MIGGDVCVCVCGGGGVSQRLLDKAPTEVESVVRQSLKVGRVHVVRAVWAHLRAHVLA
jgi:hypothetical protein